MATITRSWAPGQLFSRCTVLTIPRSVVWACSQFWDHQSWSLFLSFWRDLSRSWMDGVWYLGEMVDEEILVGSKETNLYGKGVTRWIRPTSTHPNFIKHLSITKNHAIVSPIALSHFPTSLQHPHRIRRRNAGSIGHNPGNAVESPPLDRLRWENRGPSHAPPIRD